MDITINPSKIRGTVEAVPSKSHAHRLLICAALADAPTRIVINRVSNDINATARCLRAMGAVIDEDDGVFTVKPINRNRLPVLLFGLRRKRSDGAFPSSAGCQSF